MKEETKRERREQKPQLDVMSCRHFDFIPFDVSLLLLHFSVFRVAFCSYILFDLSYMLLLLSL